MAIDLDELARLRRDYLSIPFTYSNPVEAYADHDFPDVVANALPALIAELRAYRLLEEATTVTAQWPADKYFGVTMTHRGDSSLVEKLKNLPDCQGEGLIRA